MANAPDPRLKDRLTIMHQKTLLWRNSLREIFTRHFKRKVMRLEIELVDLEAYIRVCVTYPRVPKLKLTMPLATGCSGYDAICTL